MSEQPEFTYDPTDMPALKAKMALLPEADQFPEFELDRVELGPDALHSLPGILGDLTGGQPGDVLLVTDPTPMVRDGEDLKPWVHKLLADAGWSVHTVELQPSDDGEVHADQEQVDGLVSELQPGVPVVSLGSGTVTDIAKHACFTLEEGPDGSRQPLVFCATANSMVAYTARVAVISQGGVKRTAPSRLADVGIYDTSVLRAAPPESGLAGIGDAAAMYVSFGDWYLGKRFGLGRYLDAAWEILTDVREHLLPYAREMGSRSPEGVEVLTKLLALCGLSATYAMESAPLSGYEHVNGHMLDMSAAYYDHPTGGHGAQVGMAVLPCSIAFNRLIDELDPARVDIDACFPSFEEMEARVKETFAHLDPSGGMGEECWSDYRQKLEGWHGARPEFESFLAAWDSERSKLRELVPPATQCVEALARAGLPLSYDELPVPIPDEQARWAFHNAHLMRKRFSSGDLLYYLGWFDDDFTDSVFDRMGQLAGQAREAESRA